MNTTIRDRERTVELEHVSAWRLPRFQRFAAITVGTSLLLSLIGVLCLKGDVDQATDVQIPYIQSELSRYEAGRV